MKQYKVQILKIARNDIIEAKEWYNHQQKGLGKKFVEDMKKTIVAISNNPTSFAIRYLDYRLANFHVFPYAAHFFIVEEKDLVIITAFLHTGRRPGINQQRLS